MFKDSAKRFCPELMMGDRLPAETSAGLTFRTEQPVNWGAAAGACGESSQPCEQQQTGCRLGYHNDIAENA
jgi:hypothetical protein